MNSGDTPSRQPPAGSDQVHAAYLECVEELRQFLAGVLRDADLADEALQATWLQATRAAGQSREGSRRGWLFRIAWHEALRIRRRRRVDGRAMKKMATTAQPPALNPEEQLFRRESIAAVRRALEQLPAEQRDVVRQRMYENRTFAEIAEDTGQPLGTVLTRMRLALKKLAAALPDENPGRAAD